MTLRPSPEWLLDLQERFGQLLRQPLQRDSGTLSAPSDNYDPGLVRATRPSSRLSAADRLAVYHRQFWFRLLTVMQRAHPLVVHLLGYWNFNDYAARYLVAHPPRGWDIEEIGMGFDQFLERTLLACEGAPNAPAPGCPSLALIEAVRIDSAFHAVFRVPPSLAYHPTVADAGRLGTGRLKKSPAVAILSESWPLCELRRAVLAEPSGTALALPPRLSGPRHFLVLRDQLELKVLPLAPREAELLQLLCGHPVERALGLLEAQCNSKERVDLPEQARSWLSRSVQLGVWVGLDSA